MAAGAHVDAGRAGVRLIGTSVRLLLAFLHAAAPLLYRVGVVGRGRIARFFGDWCTAEAENAHVVMFVAPSGHESSIVEFRLAEASLYE
jgi:hypothetical protein